VLASWTETCSLEAISFFAQAANTQDRALWLHPATGEALVGIGAARTLLGRGAERFKQVRDAWQSLVSDAVVDDGEVGQPYGGPLLLGGFSFDPLRRGSSARWSGFPDARLVLPERMLVVRAGGAWLTHNVMVAADERFERPEPEPEPQTRTENSADPALSPEMWKTLVGSVSRGIRNGQLGLQKVVLARAEQVQQARPFDAQLALRNLAASYPSCTVFAIAHANACFLGATPEPLIALHRGTASTFALAGSIRRGETPDEDRRLAEQFFDDPKERSEHAIVVGALRDGLAQVSTRVVSDTQPRLKKLPNVQHLVTPIRGQVAAGTSVLDLVERLHPTPAMGGFPRERALRLIRQYEKLDRGWYAGPIGWLNRDGDGEFVVGIRSALLDGNSATLFAGCGIVADSNPAREYAESGWKLQPMLAALGIAE
jgi:isochorismate synthase